MRSVVDYLNNPRDTEIAVNAAKNGYGWSRSWGAKGQKHKQFVGAITVASPTTSKYSRKVKKLSTLVTGDWASAPANNKDEIYAIGDINVPVFARIFGWNVPEGTPETFPVWIFGTKVHISDALQFLEFVPLIEQSEDMAIKVNNFIETFGIRRNFVVKGRRKTDVMQVNENVYKVAPQVIPTLEYLLAPKPAVDGEEPSKKGKHVWTVQELDRILFIANNLNNTVVLSVNNAEVCNYFAKDKMVRPVENHFTDRLLAFEKSDTYAAKFATSAFNISNYTRDGHFSVRMVDRPKDYNTIRFGAQPVMFGFRHNQTTYPPGFITTDNTAALEIFFGEISAQRNLFFVNNDGTMVDKEVVMQSVVARINQAEAMQQTRAKASNELFNAAY